MVKVPIAVAPKRDVQQQNSATRAAYFEVGLGKSFGALAIEVLDEVLGSRA